MATGPPLMVMVTGARSGIGKSTVSMSILMALMKTGIYTPNDLAYIKPATQCESDNLISKWCQANEIAYCSIGPVVYRAGFSYDVIEGKIATDALLESIRDSVTRLSAGKRFILIDGVGYPSVGSCTGTSNAEIAKLFDVPVIFVAPPGVGDPIDSINLALPFFNQYDVRVIGAVVNRISTSLTARHSLDNCDKYVTDEVRMYFRERRPDLHLFGFLPEMTSEIEAAPTTTTHPEDGDELNRHDRREIRSIQQELVGRIDIRSILDDVRSFKFGSKSV